MTLAGGVSKRAYEEVDLDDFDDDDAFFNVSASSPSESSLPAVITIYIN